MHTYLFSQLVDYYFFFFIIFLTEEDDALSFFFLLFHNFVLDSYASSRSLTFPYKDEQRTRLKLKILVF